MRSFRAFALSATALFFGVAVAGVATRSGAHQRIPLPPSTGWPTHAGGPTHSANSGTASQDMRRVLWSSALDLNPQYSGDVLFAHYGSPVITPHNTIVVPVKTGADGGFRVEARRGDTGALVWQEVSDYETPPHGWFPTFGPTLCGGDALWPREAGLVQMRPRADVGGLASRTICFYGIQNYKANPGAYSGVRISSPLTTGPDGSVYFTYTVSGDNPLGLASGIARITKDGKATYVSGAQASGGSVFVRPKLNSAVAISGNRLYVVLKQADGSDGVIALLNAQTLAPIAKRPLIDPKNAVPSVVDDDGTACPTIGPDGDVFFGVLESPFGGHHLRGWLLHFDADLKTTKTPGSFGWDDTASVVPSRLVTGYKGSSSYLLMTKYNNYVGAGDGVNRIALLDPSATQNDPYSNIASMKEILTKTSPTPDQGNLSSYPNAVREWCINTAAVDVSRGSIIVNCEDGVVYRWDLKRNEFSQSVRITAGLGQAYTPTLIGPTGIVYAVSNAHLFAVGR